MLKGVVLETCRYQAANMTDVTEKVCSDTITNFSEATIFDFARVG